MAAQRFAQAVAPFEVLDEAGRPYAHPFAGGFGSAAGYLAPKPQLADLDGDGIPDALEHEARQEQARAPGQVGGLVGRILDMATRGGR